MRSTHDSDDDSDDAQASLACSIHSLSLFFREEDFDAFAVAAPPEAAAAAVFVARLLPLVFVFVLLMLFFSVVAEEVSKDDDDDKSRRRLILRKDLDDIDVFPNPFCEEEVDARAREEEEEDIFSRQCSATKVRFLLVLAFFVSSRRRFKRNALIRLSKFAVTCDLLRSFNIDNREAERK